MDDVEVLSDATAASFSSVAADVEGLLVDDADIPDLLSAVDVSVDALPRSSGSSEKSPSSSPPSSSSALASKVDGFGDVALKALDLTFFVAEKVVEDAPRVKEEVSAIGR